MLSHLGISHRARVPGRRIAVASALMAVLALLGACSSSSSTPSGGSGSGGATNSASTSAGVTAAKALIAKYMSQPTSLVIKTPVGKPIPTGKKLAFISCGTTECAQEGAIVTQADNILGWTTTVINTDGTPQSQKSAFDQVLRMKADAVLYSAIDKSTFAPELAQLKASKTFVGACCITDPVGDGITYAVDTPDQTGTVGQLLAAWTIAQSSGSAQSVYVNLPAFPILSTAATNFKNYMSTNCPNCSVGELDIPVASLGTGVPTLVVSYLRAHPSVKYVVMSTDGLTIGVPAAIKAAGLSGIQIIGQGATTTNLQYIHTGQEQASVAFPYYEVLWGMVDAAARYEAGVPQISPRVTPTLWLLDKSNAPNATKIFPTVANYEADFKKLWGK